MYWYGIHGRMPSKFKIVCALILDNYSLCLTNRPMVQHYCLGVPIFFDKMKTPEHSRTSLLPKSPFVMMD